MQKRDFVDIADFYPWKPIKASNYTITKVKLLQKDYNSFKDNNMLNLYIDKFEVGKAYVSLIQTDTLTMMSNHPSETETNRDFLENANGDVLIFGLGLGLVIFPLLEDPEITSLVIVEKDPELIQIVGAIVKKHDIHNKVVLIESDAFTFHQSIHYRKYDTIYIDIWAKIDNRLYEEAELLSERFKSYLKSEDSNISYWCEKEKEIFSKFIQYSLR
jgi:hypothetical protein